MAVGMETAAIRDGASPSEWWGTFAPVPRSQWKAVEALNEGVWEPFIPGRPARMHELADPEFHKELFQADVVLGVDEETGYEFLVFGRHLLQDCVDLNQSVDVLKVPILQVTDELEMLLAVLNVVKGHHDYQEVA
jgi:hypothetical protein